MKLLPREQRRSLLVSLVLHVVLGAALLRVLMVPYPLLDLFRHEPAARDLPVERIGFIQLPRGAVTTPGRSGGDGRPESPAHREPPPLVAPRSVPTGVPAAPAAPAPRADAGGSGPVVGTGGPERGVRPTFADPRVWTVPSGAVVAPMTPQRKAEALEQVLRERLGIHQDSLDAIAAAGPQRAPDDWTFRKNGKTYGMDRQYIHLGSVSIPTALLGLLPLNQLGADQHDAVEKRAALARYSEIQYESQRRLNEDEFRRAVQQIRERKEREHAAAKTQQQVAGNGAASSGVTPAGGGEGQQP